MAQPDKYWDKRAIKRLTDAEKQSEEYIKRIQKVYERANRNIQQDIEDVYRNYSKATGLDVQKLKELLTASETDKLWKEMQRRGLDKYIKNNYKARISRLEKLQAQVYAKAKEVYDKEQLEHTMCYEGVVNNSYYKAIYDTQIGTGYDFAFSKIDDNMMTSLLSEQWSGANYSQRIWKNTDLLAESLSEIIGGAMMSGQSIEKTSRMIRERFDVAKYYADRLVRTETNHFNNEADAMAYEEMDVDKYVFLATLDTRTSSICQDLDHEVFDLKDRQVGVNCPPMHPNCRSKTRAYMGEEIEKTMQRRARNPVTGKTELVGNISYKEWAEQHGLYQGSEEIGLGKRGGGLKNQKENGITKETLTKKQQQAIKEEKKRAKKYATFVSFSGATDEQRLKTVNDTLDHLTEKYPTKKLNHIQIRDLGKVNANANGRRLWIDKAYINGTKNTTDWAKVIENNNATIKKLRSGWLESTWERRAQIDTKIAELTRDNRFARWSVPSGGHGVSGTITHEYGHILADQHIGLTNGSKAIAGYDVSKEGYYAHVRDKVRATYEKAVKTGDIFNVSKYAEKNEREFFAETFAMYDLGEPLPKYVVDMLTEVLNV